MMIVAPTLRRFPFGRLQDLVTVFRAVTAAGCDMQQVVDFVEAKTSAVRRSAGIRARAQSRPCTAAGCCGTQRLLPLNDTPKHYTGAILPDGSRDFSRPGPEAAIWYCDTCQELFDAPGPVRQIIAAEARRPGLVGRKSRDGGAN
jgi:hypothetical protein